MNACVYNSLPPFKAPYFLPIPSPPLAPRLAGPHWTISMRIAGGIERVKPGLERVGRRGTLCNANFLPSGTPKERRTKGTIRGAENYAVLLCAPACSKAQDNASSKRPITIWTGSRSLFKKKKIWRRQNREVYDFCVLIFLTFHQLLIALSREVRRRSRMSKAQFQIFPWPICVYSSLLTARKSEGHCAFLFKGQLQ